VEGESGGVELDVEPFRNREVRLCRNVGDDGLLLLSSDGRGEECVCAMVTSRQYPAVRRVVMKFALARYVSSFQGENFRGHVSRQLFVSHDVKNETRKT
jgi:hypothetical protein